MEHARPFCRQFFSWYDEAHCHSGIGLMTPATVHYDGRAEADHADRARVLGAAYAATPERFPPWPPALPAGAWINLPDNEYNEEAAAH